MKHTARFFVEHQLSEETEVMLADHQMHHASNVLRLGKNDSLILFNGYSGEWNCEIIDVKKRRIRCLNILREQIEERGPILAISLINPARMSILLEKTTELGVSEIVPVISRYTQHKRLNIEKAKSIVIGAAEQSRRMTVPKIHDPVELSTFLSRLANVTLDPFTNLDSASTSKIAQAYNAFSFVETTSTSHSQAHHAYHATGSKAENARVADAEAETRVLQALVVGDETMSGIPIKDALDENVAFLIGPEGGFSAEEMKMMDSYNFVKKVTMGKNILRSETAAITAIALWSILWNG
ncbi:ribosomal RNA small subunit methyltransferase E [Alphaproteobacteria bacterium]|nr:ribosomal RNA small subunit methyltransferase E [Alphaproteobacteria bacterium]